MKTTPDLPESISGVCDVEYFPVTGAERDATPDLLIEIPHGATRAAHFHAVRRRLVGTFPDDLEAFFFVNTDVGAPECARTIAQIVSTDASRPLSAVIVRSLIPRTFIDCNRSLNNTRDTFARAGFTPGLPEYITDPADVDLLKSLHRTYTDQAERAYRWVCDTGGAALALHTYAPRSVQILKIDENIVRALRKAYSPQHYDRWKKRPDIDMISEDNDRTLMASASLVAALRHHYQAAGITATENVTYRLHPSTMGHVHSARYPEQVLGLEISRARLADPFAPFEEMHISQAKAAEMAAPIAAAYLERS